MRTSYRLALAAFFLASGVLYLRGASSVFSFFWNEELLSPVFSFFGVSSWNEYAQSQTVESFLAFLVKVQVSIFFILSTLCLLPLNRKQLFRVSFVFTAVAGSNLLMGMLASSTPFLEASGQALKTFFPLILCFSVLSPSQFVVRTAKVAIALVFVAHGLKAFGVYPVPSLYMDMSTNFLHLSEANALVFLKVAASLDFLVAVSLFMPSTRVQRTALFYAATWGFATALARPLAVGVFSASGAELLFWVSEGAVRLGHWLIPLVVYFQLGKAQKVKLKKLIKTRA